MYIYRDVHAGVEVNAKTRIALLSTVWLLASMPRWTFWQVDSVLTNTAVAPATLDIDLGADWKDSAGESSRNCVGTDFDLENFAYRLKSFAIFRIDRNHTTSKKLRNMKDRASERHRRSGF